jgi:hypothetical protein
VSADTQWSGFRDLPARRRRTDARENGAFAADIGSLACLPAPDGSAITSCRIAYKSIDNNSTVNVSK